MASDSSFHPAELPAPAPVYEPCCCCWCCGRVLLLAGGNPPGRMFPERSRFCWSWGSGKKRVWCRFCTTTKVMGGASARGGRTSAGERGLGGTRCRRAGQWGSVVEALAQGEGRQAVDVASPGQVPLNQAATGCGALQSESGSPISLQASRTALYSVCKQERAKEGGGEAVAVAAASAGGRSGGRHPFGSNGRQLVPISFTHKVDLLELALADAVAEEDEVLRLAAAALVGQCE